MTLNDEAIISSLQNPRVKAVIQLHKAQARHQQKKILIEGQHPLAEALHEGIELTEIYLRQDAALPDIRLPLEPILVSSAVMAKMSTTASPAPILAIARQPYPAITLENMLARPRVFLLGLVDLQNPSNVGALVRSACAFGVDAVLIAGSQAVDVFHPKVIRASAGLCFRLPFYTLPETSTEAADSTELAKLLQKDFLVWGADAHKGLPYAQTRPAEKTALLLGSEAHGLPQDVQAWVTPLHVPMAPQAESLNVAMAGAIILAHSFQCQL